MKPLEWDPTNDEGFVSAAAKAAKEKGVSIGKAAAELLGTYRRPAPAPVALPPVDLSNDDAFVAEAVKRSIEKGIPIATAAREILHLRELDRRIAAAKR